MQNKAFSSVFCLRYFKEEKVKERKQLSIDNLQSMKRMKL